MHTKMLNSENCFQSSHGMCLQLVLYKGHNITQDKNQDISAGGSKGKKSKIFKKMFLH